MPVADYPYTTTPAKIPVFLAVIQEGGVPPKVTQGYLVKVGFKSTNDRALLPIMRFLGFIDEAGVPTELWKRYRNRGTASRELGIAIRGAYKDLFSIYHDAYNKDPETLRNYFSGATTVGERAQSAMVSTFLTLCKAADFDGAIQPLVDYEIAQGPPQRNNSELPRAENSTSGETPKFERYQSDGLVISIFPSRRNVERARKFLDVVELGLEENKAA